MRVFMVCLVAAGLCGAASAGEVISGKLRVIDGDSFSLGDVQIRLFGVDAPEVKQTCRTEQGVAWDCGVWVAQQVTARYAGQEARCTAVTTDRYGRTVARCDVDGKDISEELVLDGLAFAYRAYSDDYVLAEKSAAVRDAGLHAHRVQDPSQFRQTRAVGRCPPDPACRIKGNISAKGVRIFHVPGQRDYDRTGIRPEKDERWFCTAAEARAAGWRAAKR